MVSVAEPIRIGVVGLGWVGRARHIPTLQLSSDFRLVGVADRHHGRAAEVAKAIGGVHASHASCLADIEWIDQVDAVSIATAPFAHHDLVCEALSLGLHVITEKPFAMNPAEGRAMVEGARERGKTLAVVHNFQFARSMRRLRGDLDSGRIGEIQGVRALQLGNPQRRLPTWFEELPLGLFYDESPHLLYLLASVAGPVQMAKAVCVDGRQGRATPDQIDVWFKAPGTEYPITLSCNFVSSLSEWYLMVHGDRALGVVDVFRDIYVRLPNDGRHSTKEVIRTSAAASAQHWWQHLASGVPHLLGRLRYGNDEVFSRFARATRGDAAALEPISGEAALRTLTLQHQIIAGRENAYAPGSSACAS
jgi:scyllo-inositol 2-dehydrogenase (NADP+)